jgi:hypothetical protein
MGMKNECANYSFTHAVRQVLHPTIGAESTGFSGIAQNVVPSGPKLCDSFCRRTHPDTIMNPRSVIVIVEI